MRQEGTILYTKKKKTYISKRVFLFPRKGRRKKTDRVDEVIGRRMGMERAGLVAVTYQVDAIRVNERVHANAVD